jgi:hypothetical protein
MDDPRVFLLAMSVKPVIGEEWKEAQGKMNLHTEGP